jgi:hypothetical protein
VGFAPSRSSERTGSLQGKGKPKVRGRDAWRRAPPNRHRRRRAPGLESAAARVGLCCEVGRFLFAGDSAQRRAGPPGSWPQTRVAGRLIPLACWTERNSVRGVTEGFASEGEMGEAVEDTADATGEDADRE